MALHTPRTPQAVVLGGGYAGTQAAARLAPHARVTLVDPSDRFTERVRLHELAAGRPEVTHSRAQLLRGSGVRQVAARATAIDPQARTVTTDDGRTLPYDRLVYALGSHTPATTGTRDDRTFTAESAAELHKRLRDAPGTLAVLGGGLTGIEMAAELAESHPDWHVRLITGGEVGSGLSAKGRAHVRTVLRRLGVRLQEGHHVPDTGLDEIDADVVVRTTAMTATDDLARRTGLATDPEDRAGRLLVDGRLRSVSHPEIYVAGDAAAARAASVGRLRMACATALPTGSYAARAIAAELRGAEVAPLDYAFKFQCVSLGRRDGLIQFVQADDTPRERALTGRPAAQFKEQVVRSTVRFLKLAARHPAAAARVPGFH